MLNWFSTTESVRFGSELAAYLLSELVTSGGRTEAKSTAKAEKAMLRADQRLQEFKARERLNFYKKAKLANAFLWKLRDSGCPTPFANQLTDWLSTRL